MTPAILSALLGAREQRRAALLATRLDDGLQHLLVEGEAKPDLPATSAPPGELGSLAREALASGRGGVHRLPDGEWFLQAHLPPLRLLVVGAVHVAQALARMAASLGLHVVVIDPRTGLATAERFPGIDLVTLWPDEAMAATPPDRRTAVVTLSHEARLDDPALDAALRSPAFYVGALGSRRTQASRRERLAGLGHDAATLRRLRGPVGLPIGAIGPEEIALSILAELVAVHRGAREALALRDGGG